MASVAVAKVLPCQLEVSQKMFKSDDDQLLERMIESCQSRPCARLPGYGRQLVPFFGETGDRAGQPLERSSRVGRRGDAGKPDGRRHNKKKSPRKSVNNTRSSLNTSSGLTGSGGALDAKGSSSVGPELREDSKSDTKNVQVRNERDVQRVTRGEVGLPSAGGRNRCSQCSDNVGVASDATFAGPGYFLSPPPEALPMPTAFLLSRAMALSY